MLRHLRSGCLAALLLVLTQPAAHAQQALTAMVPPGTLSPALLERYRKERGIAVVLREQADLGEMERNLLAGTANADLVMVPAFPYLGRQIDAGVYARLDPAAIPQMKGVDPVLQQLLSHADPTGDHAVLYSWQMLGLGLVEARIGPDVALSGITFSSVFDPVVAERLGKCGIAVLDAPEHIVPAVLLALGSDPNSQEPQDLDRAKARLEALKPFIRIVDADTLVKGLADGSYCAAIAWAGELEQAQTAMSGAQAKDAAAALNDSRQQLVELKDRTEELAGRALAADREAQQAGAATQDIAARYPDLAEMAAALKEATAQAETASRAAEAARLAAEKLQRAVAVKQAEAATDKARQGSALTIRLPATGAVARFMMLAVPAKTADAARAEAFIDWLLTPDNALANTLDTHQPNAVTAAAPPAELAADPVLFPPDSIRASLTSLVQVSQTTERQRSRIWAGIKGSAAPANPDGTADTAPPVPPHTEPQ